jgi:hypothetical protein
MTEYLSAKDSIRCTPDTRDTPGSPHSKQQTPLPSLRQRAFAPPDSESTANQLDLDPFGKTACRPLIFLLSQMTEYLSAKDSIRWHS